MSATEVVTCPFDHSTLVPSRDQPQEGVLVLRCTKCALHLYVARPESESNCFTLGELEQALARALEQTALVELNDANRLRVYALANAVAKLQPTHPLLQHTERPIDSIVRLFAEC